MDQSPRGQTSQVEMIATRVCEQQGRVCTVIMENIQEKLAGLIDKVSALEKTVVTMDKSFTKEMTDVKGRMKIFTIATTVAGALAGIAGLIQLFK